MTVVHSRTRHREENVALANVAVERGEWFLGGALANPADGAVIVFTEDTPAVAEGLPVDVEDNARRNGREAVAEQESLRPGR